MLVSSDRDKQEIDAFAELTIGPATQTTGFEYIAETRATTFPAKSYAQ